MNLFYIIWMVLFASFCSSQAEPHSKSIINPDSENTIRCDTYLYTLTHEIHHTWAIRHFSIYEENRACQIHSPKLRAPSNDNFAWDIKIVPNGKDGKNETISLYVYLHKHEAIADVDVSIKNHKNETVHSMNLTKIKMGWSCSPISWENFCKKDDEFRTKMLQNDTLKLSINIRWFEPNYETVHNISQQNTTNSSHLAFENSILKFNLLENIEWILQRRNLPLADMILSSNAGNYKCDKCIEIQVHEIKFIWAIHNFSVHETLGYREILSPDIRAPTTDKYIWYIKLTPNGDRYESGTGGYISLDVYLSKESNATQALAKYNILKINHEKKLVPNEIEKSKAEMLQAGKSRYWKYFCTKSYSFRKEFLNNDTLSLFIHIKWISEPFKVKVSHQCDTSLPAATSDPNLTRCCNLSQIWESMLENSKFADVVFTTNGSEYPAHKAVLAVRSPVFAAMFQEKEQKHGKNKNIGIKVTHMSEEVLRAMLRYIYTGKCENLSELADELFIAAVKYDLNELRNICEQTLCKTVSADNAATMLEFAEKHRANGLKSKAMEFIGKVSDQKSNTTIHQ
ncbi:speckle-type POZ protein B-like [Planococcus citri]|uniref:speckle-type POZ protein B-like n=1 Tax=Planococcus citri TaxID=170843 RepID=UPI0031F7FED3